MRDAGSKPTLTSQDEFHTFQELLPPMLSGRNSAVECQLPKLDVAGSTPVARSKILIVIKLLANKLFW